jgi:hypothetical protein
MWRRRCITRWRWNSRALAGETLRLKPDAPLMQDELRDKHFFRKHGPSATYGQTKRKK